MTTTTDITDDQRRHAKLAATAAACLSDCNADEIDWMTHPDYGHGASAGGYIPDHRLQDLRELVAMRLGDDWAVHVSHRVDELDELSVEIDAAD